MAEHEEPSEVAPLWEKWNGLKAVVFALLPMECVYLCRSVCKEWNSFLSNEFITDIWAKSDINKEPWLVFCDMRSACPFMAYCFDREIWKRRVSLSFMTRGLADVHGSAAGLLLVDTTNERNGAVSGLYVCNPCTQTAIELPPMESINKVIAKGIVKGHEKNLSNTYKVVALGESGVDHDGNGVGRIVEIYDSSTKSWRMAGHLPRDLTLIKETVFLDDAFYCLTVQHNVRSILCFSITAQDESPFFFEPLPEILPKLWPHLITCGSRLLVVAGIHVQVEVEGPEDVMSITIWEFHKGNGVRVVGPSSSSGWTEIARMPTDKCEEFSKKNSSLLCFQCVGVGDSVCFMSVYRQVKNVLVYNISKKSWSWLPNCSAMEVSKCIAFVPRPYMKVD
jgi:hypothetical protein